LVTPILPLVDRCDHLYIAPDAGLWAVPYDALPLGVDGLVTDRFLVSYVSSPRDLLELRPVHQAGAAVIVAAPDFDLDNPGGRRLDEEISERVLGNHALLESGGGISITYEGERLDAPELPTYAPLPGTRAEAAAIATRLGVAAILGPGATKKAVLDLQSPEILHIASHGYFFGPGGWDEINMARLASATSFSFAETMAAMSQLTGRVQGLLGNGDADASATGDSARAAPEQHAGVFGLRRAFVLAGAGDLVLSLWRVADEHTAALMTAFYDALAQGAAPTQALRKAKLEMRRTHADPYYWAAFTCQVRRTEILPTAKERP
jgi:CHAT domain-containing protein